VAIDDTDMLEYPFDMSQLESPMETARVFWSGRSQAIRLPKEFRVDSDTVRIRRHGASIILEPVAKDWAWLDAISGKLDSDFQSAALAQPLPQERPELF
jgi:antitoxin VapB